MRNMIKTTKKQFKLFCDEFKRQVERMGLMEWELRFFHEAMGTNLGGLLTDHLGRVARVSFTWVWDDDMEISDEQIKMVAKHEAIELLIAELVTMAVCRYVTESEVDAVRHALVRRLEKLL